MNTQVHSQTRLRWARVAVSATFFVVGAVFANWVSRIPQVTETLNLSESQLGIILMVMSTGVIMGLLMSSGVIARFGSRQVSAVGAMLYALTLMAIGFATDAVILAGILFFFGMFNSVVDVAMNAQGIEVEQRAQKPIMNSFHAFWSVGTFVGALMGSGFVAAGASVQQHFMLAPIVMVALMLWAGRYLLTIPDEQNAEHTATFQLPPAPVWGLGAVAFAAGLSEGAFMDWGGLYLHDVVGTSESTAALGLAAFSTTMVVGRFTGDSIAARLGASRLVRGGGVLASVGIALLIAIPHLLTVFIGFAMIGMGIAVAIPLAFSAAGKLPNISPGRGVAGVATIGYAAFLVGPPIIGFIAEATSLRVGFGVVLLLALSLIFTGRALAVGKIKR